MASFSADISAFIKKTGLRADIVLRKIGLDAYTGVLLRSPVDTGRFRASWRIGVNEADTSVSPPRKRRSAKQGAPPTAGEGGRAGAKIDEAKFGDTIIISNNLPYARPLELGHSGQAPQGIVGPTFDDLSQKLSAAIEAARTEAP